MARVEFMTKERADPKVREIMEKMESNGWPVLNIFKTVLVSPRIGPAFLRFGNAILEKAHLSPYLRELAILRVGYLTQANYEWTQHVPIGLRCGVSQGQIDAISGWSASRLFGEEDRAVLQYTDEVTRNVRVSDATFATLRKFLSEVDVVELTLTVGFYNLVSRMLESMQVELEDPEAHAAHHVPPLKG
ncbi:MAG: carboxymuconolactone decarboxylase family protein [Candidatus Lambdaproteobacteria bacterium]|nr:carboxymuconolactone decarboxylase family protein [Candidatus Lambdaproteobacteria bacterium]